MNIRTRTNRKGVEVLELQYGTSDWSAAIEKKCLWCNKPFITRKFKPGKTCSNECRYKVQIKAMRNSPKLNTRKRCPFCNRTVRVGKIAAKTFKHCGGIACIQSYRVIWKDELNKKNGHGDYNEHGAIRYWHGCRCDVCKRGHALKARKYIKHTPENGETRGRARVPKYT